MAEATSILDGAYVTALGDEDTLFRIQHGQRQSIKLPDIAALGITQKDIQVVDPLVLHSMPLKDPRQRAIGREVRSYLASFLGAGHYMKSWVWLQGTTLTITTRTETITLFGGYTGGVQVVLFDAAGHRIQHDTIKYRYGVDGRFFGSGSREDTESYQLPQSVADSAESIVIAHYWDPKVNLVEAAIVVGQIVWELIKLLQDANKRGEAVNGGGQPF
jgi:hypothetical protein